MREMCAKYNAADRSESFGATGVHHAVRVFGSMFPTNAGIPELETLFVGEFDDEASPLGAKRLGELTTVSVVPATITNAVYHATGTRIREICRSHWKSFHKGRSRTTGSAVHLPTEVPIPHRNESYCQGASAAASGNR
jgi:hypothetical protein